MWDFIMGNKRKNEESPIIPLNNKHIKYDIETIEKWAKGDGNCSDLTTYLNVKEWHEWHRRRREEPINTENLTYLPKIF